jgi:putative N-acetyltransferase (TIGR04045 family)
MTPLDGMLLDGTRLDGTRLDGTRLDGGTTARETRATPRDILLLLGDGSTLARQPDFHIEQADGPAMDAYRRLRRKVFVEEQGLFEDHDGDDRDDDPRTIVLVALDRAGCVVGGVRLGPVDGGPDIGWWTGARLVVARGARGPASIGAALVRAACARAEAEGVLRFEATVQKRGEVLFRRIGWTSVRQVTFAGAPHALMRWPIGRIEAQARASKSALGPLLSSLRPGGAGFVGDDGAPVPGTDLVAACDAIVPSMVDRDPEWAGWCSVLVNINDLAAMGAMPLGLLDALAARDASHATRVLAGLHRAARAYDVPVLGGHTHLGATGALSVTALGRARHPVSGGGGRPGHLVRFTADLAGTWRTGYRGRQWDSTTHRRTDELRAMTSAVAVARPAAAKDVSMAGIVGTLGMLAEASGCAAIVDVAAVPRPAGVTVGDWFTCFPGYAMLTAHDREAAAALPAGPAVGVVCGELTEGQGVGLRWPDGQVTQAITGAVTGLGTA